MADAMQENNENPYIIANIGLRRLSSNLGFERISLINQVPSSRSLR